MNKKINKTKSKNYLSKDQINLRKWSKLINWSLIARETKLSLPELKKNIKNYQWITNIIMYVPLINILHNLPVHTNLENFIIVVFKWIFHKGEKRCIELLKMCKQNLQQHALNQKVTRVPFLKVDKDGFVKVFKWLKPNRAAKTELRYAFSLFRITDTFTGPVVVDTSTITNPSTACPELVKDIKSFMHKSHLLKRFTNLPDKDEGYLPLSNKSGPNGPCTVAAIADLTALKNSKNKKLFKAIKQQLKLTLPWLNLDGHDDVDFETIEAKTIGLQDKFYKTRPISIVDFWSNAALSGIHKTCMTSLSKISSDYTFKQSKIPEGIKNLGKSIHSSDMTAFTDRFPRELEREVVQILYDSDVADRWDIIIAQREFLLKGRNANKYITYSAGNPMGVLSSWAVSTLTHHIIKHYCAYKNNTQKYKYMILGDDTLDSNRDIYNTYIEVIKTLGVNISESKCTTSEQGSGEFAKRLFRKNIEITGVPVHLLKDLHKMPENFLELSKMMRGRGYHENDVQPAVSNLLLHLVDKSTRYSVWDQLSLPEKVSGMLPLLKGVPGSRSQIFNDLTNEEQEQYLVRARDLMFYAEANKLSYISANQAKNTSKFVIKPNHPIVFAITQKLEPFLGLDDQTYESFDYQKNPEKLYEEDTWDDFTIYNQWLKGSYREMLRIPSIDSYKFATKGHKISRSKYLILKKMLELVNTTDTNIFLQKNHKISDDDLYNIGLMELQSSFLSTGFSQKNKGVDACLVESIANDLERNKERFNK